MTVASDVECRAVWSFLHGMTKTSEPRESDGAVVVAAKAVDIVVDRIFSEMLTVATPVSPISSRKFSRSIY